MKPATRLIHLADGVNADAAPLTTPIYETSTYVFESAQEVRDYNEGRSTKFLYSRYANPTVVAVDGGGGPGRHPGNHRPSGDACWWR